MRANRGNRLPSWAAWLSVAALVGLTVGPVVAVVAAGACAAVLTAEEVGYRRRARAYFARLHRSSRRRHDAILDGWMEMRENADADAANLADDVRRKPAARFVTAAAVAADRRDAARPRDYRSIAAYADAVADLERAWRRLEMQARGLELWGDARRWGRDHLPEAATTLVAPLVPVVRSAAQAAWRAAEARFVTPARDDRTA
ncbi:hypothetical protein [Mumia sp. DW29H23]|uniref:hypothetical protein n=1 Tax=Mumia sp. DW29H23 TaxID=3421241 RepID=UPI003D69CA5C